MGSARTHNQQQELIMLAAEAAQKSAHEQRNRFPGHVLWRAGIALLDPGQGIATHRRSADEGPEGLSRSNGLEERPR